MGVLVTGLCVWRGGGVGGEGTGWGVGDGIVCVEGGGVGVRGDWVGCW